MEPKTITEKYARIKEIPEQIESGEIKIETEKAVKVCNLADILNGVCETCNE
jgi:anti-sigma28 factor (negative regulator of flagellin synthesis)